MSVNNHIKKVLVAPLDWGLGHATRCIPIIEGLLSNGFEVVIAAEGPQASLLQAEFPFLLCLPLTGYRIKYSKNPLWLPLTLISQLPRLFATIRREQRWLKLVIKQYGIHLVIADNRYGLFSKIIPCIFITHQLTIKAPFTWLERLLQYINYRYINRFAACWVPDTESNVNIAGILSHPRQLPKIPVLYIGLLSRFREKTAEKKYDYCILLSGPEPQRSLLEEKIIAGLGAVEGKILLVRGLPGSKENLAVPDNTEVHNHLPGSQLQQAFRQSDYIVSRSGYTTVMEVLSMHKKTILIPTPGQTEQEYLAGKLQQARYCFSVTQDTFQCAQHFALAKTFHYQIPDFPFFHPASIPDILKASV